MQADFVLSRWSADEQKIVNLKIDKCLEIIESWASIGIEKTMSTVNNWEFV
jgi:PTH1 family peptidyl-tRNA hydrolase